MAKKSNNIGKHQLSGVLEHSLDTNILMWFCHSYPLTLFSVLTNDFNFYHLSQVSQPEYKTRIKRLIDQLKQFPRKIVQLLLLQLQDASIAFEKFSHDDSIINDPHLQANFFNVKTFNKDQSFSISDEKLPIRFKNRSIGLRSPQSIDLT